MYRWKFLSQSTLFGWGGCRVAMEIARADDFWYTPPMSKSKSYITTRGGGGGWMWLWANAHTSCADQFETDISACMCRIHHHVLCLWGGGGVTPQLLLRVPGIHLILFLNIFCACYGRGGGEGDYWTSRYRLFNKFCHGFLSGLGYYLSYFSNRLQWCGNYISVYVITYHKNYVNIYVRMHKFCVDTVNPSFKGHCDEGTPCHQGTLSQNHDLSSTC